MFGQHGHDDCVDQPYETPTPSPEGPRPASVPLSAREAPALNDNRVRAPICSGVPIHKPAEHRSFLKRDRFPAAANICNSSVSH